MNKNLFFALLLLVLAGLSACQSKPREVETVNVVSLDTIDKETSQDAPASETILFEEEQAQTNESV